MIVGVSVFELHLPSSRSLKDKRRVVKALVERIHARHRVSIAETGHHDLHQRAEVALAIVSTSEAEVEKMLDGIRDMIDEVQEAYVTRWEPQILEAM